VISVVIPHWSIGGLDENLKRCVNSLSGKHEFIIVVNDGIGFAKAVNQGLRLASGDYIAVVNNDTELVEGSLQALCREDSVCIPKDQNNGYHLGPFFCMARSVYKKVGDFDEQFETGFYEDDDYMRRLEQASVAVLKIESVRIDHLGGTTMKHISNIKKIAAINKKRYEEKWEL